MHWQTMLTRVDKEVLKQKNCKNFHAHKKQMTMEVLTEFIKNSDQILIPFEKAAELQSKISNTDTDIMPNS